LCLTAGESATSLTKMQGWNMQSLMVQKGMRDNRSGIACGVWIAAVHSQRCGVNGKMNLLIDPSPAATCVRAGFNLSYRQ